MTLPAPRCFAICTASLPALPVAPLTPDAGMLILDVVAGEIACLEVLDRDDVREKLRAVLS
jgi:hypothetical protein